MTQLKVFEFAKQIGVETLTLMDKIREWQLPIKSHMATLDEAMMTEIQSRLDSARQAAADASKAKKKTARKKKAEGAAAAAPAPAPEAPLHPVRLRPPEQQTAAKPKAAPRRRPRLPKRRPRKKRLRKPEQKGRQQRRRRNHR